VIGPDVIESWPAYYPNLSTDGLLTSAAQDNSKRLSAECIKESGLEGQLRQTLGQDFFAVDPLTLPDWAKTAQQQTPPPLPASMPVFIAQGTADTVVLPWPNAIVRNSGARPGRRSACSGWAASTTSPRRRQRDRWPWPGSPIASPIDLLPARATCRRRFPRRRRG
jgi:hypothetical protein